MGTRAYIGIAFVLAAVASFGAILPESFEKNDGQWSAEILYAQRNPTGAVLLQQDRIVLATGGERIEVIFAGAAKACRVRGDDLAESTTHYLLGNDPKQWKTSISAFRRVTYENVYPATDISFYVSDRGLEFDVIVRPGGDLSAVRLNVKGAAVSRRGHDVMLRSRSTTIRMNTPDVYAVDGASKRHVAGVATVDRRGGIGFRTPHYDGTRTLVIDPTLTFSSYLGGSSGDWAWAVAADADGHVFVAGRTESRDLPLTAAVQNSFSGAADVFVSEIDSRTGQVVFTTYLGGSGYDSMGGIALSRNGGIIVAGTTSSANFPVMKPLQPQLRGQSDVFVAKITPSGDRLEFSTYFGGSGEDSAAGPAVDRDDNVYIGGETTSSDLPVAHALQPTFGGAIDDGFVAKLNSSGLLYCTYLGGSGRDWVSDLAIDNAGDVFMAGISSSTDSPLHWPGHPGEQTAFVAKLDASGERLVYTKFLGGTGTDSPTRVAVDRHGAAVVVGATSSRDLPLVNAIDSNNEVPSGSNTGLDGFIGKVSADGSRFDFLTYLGGIRSDAVSALGLDGSGNIFVAGGTLSPDFPVMNPLQHDYSGGQSLGDMFVSELSSTGANLVFSTYLGTSAEERAQAIAVAPGGLVHVVGWTSSPTFPVSHAFQPVLGGGFDALVLTLQGSADALGEDRVLPVVASAPGLLGSLYKTSVQLHNPRQSQTIGQLVFHPANRSASPDDPSMTFAIQPGATETFGDIVQTMSTTGIGSVDLITAPGSAPESVVRMFNDAGALGTTGMTEEQFSQADALQPGMRGVLLIPSNLSVARFNIGIRTLAEAVSVKMTVRHADGSVVGEIASSYLPNYLVQGKADDFIGLHVAGNDSILFEVLSGSAIIYGVANDNITQDPNLQFVRPLGAVSEARIIPVVASGPGLLDSLFKTAVQIHNAGTTPISGRFVFHSQGTPAATGDPALDYSLTPGQTLAYDNLLTAMATGGVGTLDIVPESGNAPVSVVRVFNDAGAKGTTGMTEDQITPEYVLRKGERGVLIAPLDSARFRFNIGVRALEEGAAMTVTVRSRRGDVLKSFSTSYEPNYFAQKSSSDLLGMTPDASDSVTFRIDSGSAIVYGATTDNTTQDPSQQVARALTN